MNIKPFNAFRYDGKLVGKAGDCISPPYDVINDQLQDQLYQKNPYNIVRVIKGKKEPTDNETQNQYTRAADYLNTWIEKGILKKDQDKTIYAYVQNFVLADKNVQRLSFIALTKLEDFGKTVRAHEQTLNGPLIDRLQLKRACKAKFGLVFMLYEDPKNIADKIIEKSVSQKPLIDFIDEQDVQHRLFAITGPDDIDAIKKMMETKACVIADGHHRYTTGLTYAKENPDNPNAQYQMIAFSNTCHQGLVVLATHRLLNNLEDFDINKTIVSLKENFEITEFTFDSDADKQTAREKVLTQMKAEQAKGKNAFSIYAGNGLFYLAVLKDTKKMDSIVPDKSPAWRSLDVSVLHKLILENLLGLDEQKLAGGTYVQYVKDTPNAIDDSIENIDSGLKKAAFFMNAPKIEQIQAVADQGERMPQKSTYFYPKIYTGLTINKL